MSPDIILNTAFASAYTKLQKIHNPNNIPKREAVVQQHWNNLMDKENFRGITRTELLSNLKETSKDIQDLWKRLVGLLEYNYNSYSYQDSKGEENRTSRWETVIGFINSDLAKFLFLVKDNQIDEINQWIEREHPGTFEKKENTIRYNLKLENV